MTAQTITETTAPGQTEKQTYGVDTDGNLYTLTTNPDTDALMWWPENDATRLVREARAAGKRSSIEVDGNGAWRKGENWMIRNRKVA